MKRFVFALVLLCGLVFGCFAGYSQLKRSTADLATQVLAVDAQLAEHPRAALSALQETYALWRSRQAFLGALVRHDELDEIQALFVRARQCLADGDVAAYRLQSCELRDMLLHLPEMERPSIGNVF